jgi:hypothetical protein
MANRTRSSSTKATLALVSDQISRRVMAAGLSAESQRKTVLAAALAPVPGAFADRIGVGAALAALRGLTVVLAAVLRVRPGAEVSEAAGQDPVGRHRELQKPS